MKEKFFEFYPPSKEEFQKLWNESHFVFDSNVLLNLYMYSESTLNDYWKVFQKIKNRIWIPHQVGFEFHKNRASRIIEQQTHFDKVISALQTTRDSNLDDLKTAFSKLREHPILNKKKIIEGVDLFFKDLLSEIEGQKEKYPNFMENQDPISDTLNTLFAKNVGEKFDPKKQESIINDGKKRYDKNIPPGFKDINKNGDEKFGDLLAWMQIIDFAKKDIVSSIIFITDDNKADWWQTSQGRTISPHPLLIREFHEKVGKKYYQYNSSSFLRYANNTITSVKADSVSETEKYSAELAFSELPDSINGFSKRIMELDNFVVIEYSKRQLFGRYLHPDSYPEEMVKESLLFDVVRPTLKEAVEETKNIIKTLFANAD
jgi:hypothetical protein